MNKCDLEAICAFIDGELPDDHAARLRAHLDECPSCRALYEDFRALKKGFAELEVSPPDTLKPGIMYKIGLGDDPPRLKRITGSLIRVAAIAACVSIVLYAAQRNDMFSPEPEAAYEMGGGIAEQSAIVGDLGIEANFRANSDEDSEPMDIASSPADPAPDLPMPGMADYGKLWGDDGIARSHRYDAFIELLEEYDLEYSLMESAPENERRIWIGGAPYEIIEIELDGLTLIIYAGEGIDINSLIEQTRLS